MSTPKDNDEQTITIPGEYRIPREVFESFGVDFDRASKKLDEIRDKIAKKRLERKEQP